MRWLTPVILLAAAGYVFHHNGQGGGVIALSFLDVVVPSLKGDPVGLGQLTWKVLGGLGLLTGIGAVLRR